MRRSWSPVAFVAMLIACAVPGATAVAASPAELLTSILAAGRSQSSVHYVSVLRVGGGRIVQVADVAATSGIQRITFATGGKTGHVTILVSSKTAYFRGDPFVLVNYMGLRASAAPRYANTWIRVPRADRLYTTIAEDVTLPSTISTLRLSGTPEAAPSTTIHGQRVVGVRWRMTFEGKPVVSTLYARAAGKPLPVEERAVRDGDSVTVSFTRWSRPIRVDVPASAVPISSTGLE